MLARLKNPGEKQPRPPAKKAALAAQFHHVMLQTRIEPNIHVTRSASPRGICLARTTWPRDCAPQLEGSFSFSHADGNGSGESDEGVSPDLPTHRFTTRRHLMWCEARRGLLIWGSWCGGSRCFGPSTPGQKNTKLQPCLPTLHVDLHLAKSEASGWSCWPPAREGRKEVAWLLQLLHGR